MIAMQLIQLLPLLLAGLGVAHAADAAARTTVTVQAWPLSSANPQPLAEVSYDAKRPLGSIEAYTPPNTASNSKDLIRVGLYDSIEAQWRGVVTSAASFDEKYQQKLMLHLDEEGNVWHVAISTIQKPKPKKGKMVNGKREAPEVIPQVVVEVVPPTPGPSPILNKPIVLNAEGKLAEKEQEKTFLQKYWYIIAIVLLFQVFTASGGDKK